MRIAREDGQKDLNNELRALSQRKNSDPVASLIAAMLSQNQ